MKPEDFLKKHNGPDIDALAVAREEAGADVSRRLVLYHTVLPRVPELLLAPAIEAAADTIRQANYICVVQRECSIRARDEQATISLNGATKAMAGLGFFLSRHTTEEGEINRVDVLLVGDTSDFTVRVYRTVVGHHKPDYVVEAAYGIDAIAPEGMVNVAMRDRIRDDVLAAADSIISEHKKRLVSRK